MCFINSAKPNLGASVKVWSGTACYRSVQNVLSSSLIPKYIKIEIYRTIILPVVLYGRETWSLTLREKG